MDFQNCFPIWNRLTASQQDQILGSLMTRKVSIGEEASIEETDKLKITHESIANHLGSHREVITRMLRYFQNEGMVKLSRGTIELTNAQKLKQLCGE